MNVILIDERCARAKDGVDLSGHLGRGVVPDFTDYRWTTVAGATADLTGRTAGIGVLLEAPTEDGGRVKVAIGGIIHGAVGGEAIPADKVVCLGPDGKFVRAETVAALLSPHDDYYIVGMSHTACSGDGATFAINLNRSQWAIVPSS